MVLVLSGTRLFAPTFLLRLTAHDQPGHMDFNPHLTITGSVFPLRCGFESKTQSLLLLVCPLKRLYFIQLVQYFGLWVLGCKIDVAIKLQVTILKHDGVFGGGMTQLLKNRE